MHPRTAATLEELGQADWFACVGMCDTETARVLPSWRDAVASCSSPKWQDLLLEASNQYCERVAERSRSRFNDWNRVVARLRPVAQALVRQKTGAVVNMHKLPEIFVATVDWDILGVCMEAEYADVYPAGFFASQAYWYVKGHFPCGWEGAFPQGRLLVY